MAVNRIPPLSTAEWPPEMDAALASRRSATAAASLGQPGDRAANDRPRSNLIGILAWHPELAQAYFALSTHLSNSTLADRTRELAIVRTGWNRRAEYEWAQHVRLAKAVGVTDDEIAAISEGPGAALWTPFESAVLRAVDEITADSYVSDATWTTLSAELDRRQLMDLVFTIGAYDMLGMAMNTFGLELDPGLVGFDG